MPNRQKACLKEFAKTGALGPVALGVHRLQVLAELGRPSVWYIKMVGMKNDDDVAASPIWKYGDAEVHFDDKDFVWLIHFDMFSTPRGTRALPLAPWIIRAQLPFAELEEGLRIAGIAFKTAPYIDSGCIGILTEGGVEFVVQVDAHRYLPQGLSVFGRPLKPVGRYV